MLNPEIVPRSSLPEDNISTITLPESWTSRQDVIENNLQ